VNEATAPTAFVGPCIEDNLSRVVWCIKGDATQYLPNDAACSHVFDVSDIFCGKNGSSDVELENLSKSGIAIMPTANQAKPQAVRTGPWKAYGIIKRYRDLALRIIAGEIPAPRNGTDPQVWLDRYDNFMKDNPEIRQEVTAKEALKKRTSPFYDVRHRK
jgi:hypothetical protein